MAGGAGANAADAVRQVNGLNFFASIAPGVEAKDLRGLADEAKARIGSGLVAIIGVQADGKASLVTAVTADLAGRFSAVDLVRAGAEALGGKGGGGRPDMAQAGGPDGARAEAALAAIAAAIGRG